MDTVSDNAARAASQASAQLAPKLQELLEHGQEGRSVVQCFMPYTQERDEEPIHESKLGKVKLSNWPLLNETHPLTYTFEGEEYKVEAYVFIVSGESAWLNYELSVELQKLYLEALKQQLGIA